MILDWQSGKTNGLYFGATLFHSGFLSFGTELGE